MGVKIKQLFSFVSLLFGQGQLTVLSLTRYRPLLDTLYMLAYDQKTIHFYTLNQKNHK